MNWEVERGLEAGERVLIHDEINDDIRWTPLCDLRGRTGRVLGPNIAESHSKEEQTGEWIVEINGKRYSVDKLPISDRGLVLWL